MLSKLIIWINSDMKHPPQYQDQKPTQNLQNLYFRKNKDSLNANKKINFNKRYELFAICPHFQKLCFKIKTITR